MLALSAAFNTCIMVCSGVVVCPPLHPPAAPGVFAALLQGVSHADGMGLITPVVMLIMSFSSVPAA